MVESRDAFRKESPRGSQTLTNQAWAKALVEQDVFEGDMSTWRITDCNYQSVLKAINVNVTQFEQSLKRALATNND